MSGSLPQNIQWRLDQTLAQWRHWHCTPPLQAPPEILGRLGQGISNYSFLVGAQQRFVIRIDGVNPATNGLSRQAEWRALEDASERGLAPHPRYFNPELGSLVCDYLMPDSEQVSDPVQIATLLRAIHRLPPLHHRLDLGERILRYRKQLIHRGELLPRPLSNLETRLQVLLERLPQKGEPTVLCHNDLLLANRLSSDGSVWALDWEYCAMGSPWYDLAVICSEGEFNPAWANILLSAYLERAPTIDERNRLRDFRCCYYYLEILWYLTLRKTPPGEDFLHRRMATLKDTLQAKSD